MISNQSSIISGLGESVSGYCVCFFINLIDHLPTITSN